MLQSHISIEFIMIWVILIFFSRFMVPANCPTGHQLTIFLLFYDLRFLIFTVLILPTACSFILLIGRPYLQRDTAKPFQALQVMSPHKWSSVRYLFYLCMLLSAFLAFNTIEGIESTPARLLFLSNKPSVTALLQKRFFLINLFSNTPLCIMLRYNDRFCSPGGGGSRIAGTNWGEWCRCACQ